jgi:hypothetical protein
VPDSQSPSKAFMLSGVPDRLRDVGMDSDDSYHFISPNSSSGDVQRTPTAEIPRPSTPKPRSRAYLPDQTGINLYSNALPDASVDFRGSRGKKRPIAESRCFENSKWSGGS